MIRSFIRNMTAAAAFAADSPGERVRDWVSKVITELEIPLVVIAALFLIIRVGYPLLTGDEQDHRTVKKRIFPIILGIAVIGGAIYWANWIKEFVAF